MLYCYNDSNKAHCYCSSNGGRSFKKHRASKKRISITNLELKLGMLDYWPLATTKSKEQENVKISSQ